MQLILSSLVLSIRLINWGQFGPEDVIFAYNTTINTIARMTVGCLQHLIKKLVQEVVDWKSSHTMDTSTIFLESHIVPFKYIS